MILAFGLVLASSIGAHAAGGPPPGPALGLAAMVVGGALRAVPAIESAPTEVPDV